MEFLLIITGQRTPVTHHRNPYPYSPGRLALHANVRLMVYITHPNPHSPQTISETKPPTRALCRPGVTQLDRNRARYLAPAKNCHSKPRQTKTSPLSLFLSLSLSLSLLLCGAFRRSIIHYSFAVSGSIAKLPFAFLLFDNKFPCFNVGSSFNHNKTHVQFSPLTFQTRVFLFLFFGFQ